MCVSCMLMYVGIYNLYLKKNFEYVVTDNNFWLFWRKQTKIHGLYQRYFYIGIIVTEDYTECMR